MFFNKKLIYCIFIMFISNHLYAQLLQGFPLNPSPGCSDGAIYTWIFSGIPPYTFQWSNGLSGSYQTDLAAGNYCVTVTDVTCCQSIRCFQLHDEGVIEVTGSRNPIADGLCDGSIDVTATGAGAPFSFEWSNGETTEDIENLCVGSYTVTITSQKGCFKILTAQISKSCYDDPANPNRIPEPFIIQPDVSSVTNSTYNNGFIQLNVQSGSPPYYFIWSGPNNFSARDPHIQNLTIGTYCVKASDGCGQQFSQCFTINDCSTAAPIHIALNTDIKSCNGVIERIPNGPILPGTTITATPNGGTPPFQFLWSTGSILNPIRQTKPGIYYVTVTDSRSCKAHAEVKVLNGYSEERNGCLVTAFCNGKRIKSFIEPGQGSISLEELDSKCQIILKCNNSPDIIFQGQSRTITDLSACERLTVCDFGGFLFLNRIEDFRRKEYSFRHIPPPPNCQTCSLTKICIEKTTCTLTGAINERSVNLELCGSPIREEEPELRTLTKELKGIKLIRNLAELEYLFRQPEGIPIDYQKNLLQKTENDTAKSGLYQIFPNPFDDNIYIQYESAEANSIQVELTNIYGQTVQSKAFESIKGTNTQVLQVDNFATGIYIVKLRDKRKILYITKLLKAK
jgi:hypothetical protein